MIDWDRTFSHAGVDLRMTCGACPEQYDAYRNGISVGYFRLRHGCFTVNAWGPSGAEVYEGYPEGDGIFQPDERDRFLTEGIDALLAYLDRPQPPEVNE